jgi:hypothetical protein
MLKSFSLKYGRPYSIKLSHVCLSEEESVKLRVSSIFIHYLWLNDWLTNELTNQQISMGENRPRDANTSSANKETVRLLLNS